MARVALITGANKGLGFHMCQQLARSDPQLTVLLASRDRARGLAALKSLNMPNIHHLELDVSSSASIDAAVQSVKQQYGGLDMLCNNAGVLFKGRDTAQGDQEAVQQTLAINYHGLVEMCQKFLPLMRQNGRIVNVASSLGPAALNGMSESVRSKFLQQDTLEGLNEQVSAFRSAFESQRCEELGWARSCYGVSKMAVIRATRILAKEAKNGVTLNSGCPGWCKTEMTSDLAPRSPEDGAATLLYLLTLPASDRTTGEYWEDRAICKY